MKKVVHQLNLDTVGGVENLFANYVGLSEGLSHELLVSSKRIHPQLKAAVESNTDVIKYIKYLGPMKLPKFVRRLWAKKIVRDLNPDVMVFWNTATHTTAIAMEKKIPYVYYDHGLSWLSPDADRYRAFLKGATKIIACGYSSKRMMELRWGVPAEKIVVVPNGFREDAVPPNLQAKRLESGRPLRLGLAGRLIPIKGASIAIHMLKELISMGVSAELHIAGEGKDRALLERTVTDLKLEEHVTLLGVVDDMHRFYQSIDFFVSPTLRDPFPLVAIEAISHGCVPIFTAVDGCPDIIDHGKTGFCINPTLPLSDYPSLGGSLSGLPKCIYNPSTDALSDPLLPDPVRMAEVIKSLVDAPDTYHEVSRQGIDVGKSRFKFSHYVKGLDQALREV